MRIGPCSSPWTQLRAPPQKEFLKTESNRIDQMLNEAIAANQVPGLWARLSKMERISLPNLPKALRTFLSQAKNGKGSDLPIERLRQSQLPLTA